MPPLATSFTEYPGSGLQRSSISEPPPIIAAYCIGVPVGVSLELKTK
nr:MAG TPA: hypothetical protein [Caudoviricetes sp.]